MPVGTKKNLIYGALLSVMGMPCRWKGVHAYGTSPQQLERQLEKVLKHNHVVGTCIQVIRGGSLAECYCAGNTSLAPPDTAAVDAIYRTASIAKMACALLVMRLYSLGKLDIHADISTLWHAPIRNPHFPDIPIPLSSLLSHTSGMVDSPLYFQALNRNITADAILADNACFAPSKPHASFRYSNFAAGLVGSLLEHHFGLSFEALIQQEVFEPLGIKATFDISTLDNRTKIANSYRVLPAGKSPAFDAQARRLSAVALHTPDPQLHFTLASGNLLITALGLAQLALPFMNDGTGDNQPFLSKDAVAAVKAADTAWPEPTVRMRHGLGLLELDDPSIHAARLYGHQGFAYGAVNGVFFDEAGNGFASLNSGASERRIGHLSCLNRDLIQLLL